MHTTSTIMLEKHLFAFESAWSRVSNETTVFGKPSLKCFVIYKAVLLDVRNKGICYYVGRNLSQCLNYVPWYSGATSCQSLLNAQTQACSEKRLLFSHWAMVHTLWLFSVVSVEFNSLDTRSDKWSFFFFNQNLLYIKY